MDERKLRGLGVKDSADDLGKLRLMLDLANSVLQNRLDDIACGEILETMRQIVKVKSFLERMPEPTIIRLSKETPDGGQSET